MEGTTRKFVLSCFPTPEQGAEARDGKNGQDLDWVVVVDGEFLLGYNADWLKAALCIQ